MWAPIRAGIMFQKTQSRVPAVLSGEIPARFTIPVSNWRDNKASWEEVPSVNQRSASLLAEEALVGDYTLEAY